MKLITALVENTTPQDIQNALPDASSEWSITLSNVLQHESRDVVTHVYRGVSFTTRFAERVRLDIEVYDQAAAEVIDWITSATGASLIGPTRVSITATEAVLDIRGGQSTRALPVAA